MSFMVDYLTTDCVGRSSVRVGCTEADMSELGLINDQVRILSLGIGNLLSTQGLVPSYHCYWEPGERVCTLIAFTWAVDNVEIICP